MRESTKMVPNKTGKVPSIGDETWLEIACAIIDVCKNAVEGVSDETFKKLGWRSEYVYSIRRELVEKGIIKKSDRRYTYVKCNFVALDDVRAFIEMIRSNNADQVKVGIEYLRKMCAFPTRIAEPKRDVLRELVHITEAKEVGDLFQDLLDGRLVADGGARKELLKALVDSLAHIRHHSYQDRLKLLKQSWGTKMRDLVLSESDVDLLALELNILQEIGAEDEFVLDSVRGLLAKWGKDAEDFSMAIIPVLTSLNRRKVMRCLIEWARSKEEALKHGATLFLRYMAAYPA